MVLAQSVERRAQIEKEMKELALGMCARMEEVEAMIVSGYEGRASEVASVLAEVEGTQGR